MGEPENKSNGYGKDERDQKYLAKLFIVNLFFSMALPNAITSKIKSANAKKLHQKINRNLNYYFLNGEVAHQPPFVSTSAFVRVCVVNL